MLTEYISNTRCERDIFGSKTKRVVAIHVHSLLDAGTGSKQVKSIKVGQEVLVGKLICCTWCWRDSYGTENPSQSHAKRK